MQVTVLSKDLEKLTSFKGGILTDNNYMCYNNIVFKSLFLFFLVFNFVSVQTLASVCESKCNLAETTKTEKISKTEEQPNCHSSISSDERKTSDKDCGSVCQTDELNKIDTVSFEFADNITKEIFFPNQGRNFVLNHELSFLLNIHDPPRNSFYLGIAIFIQKSSFLI